MTSPADFCFLITKITIFEVTKITYITSYLPGVLFFKCPLDSERTQYSPVLKHLPSTS